MKSLSWQETHEISKAERNIVVLGELEKMQLIHNQHCGCLEASLMRPQFILHEVVL